MSTQSPDRAKTANVSSTAGFTVLEVLVVGAVLSVAALVVGLNLQTDAPLKIELAASEVAQSVRFAQNEARRAAIPYGVHIESGALRVRLVRDVTASVPPAPTYDVYNPISKQLYRLDLAQALPGSDTTLTLTTSWVGTCDDPSFLYFDSLGRPRCGSSWGVLLNAATVKLDWGDQTQLVTVDGETGRVTIR